MNINQLIDRTPRAVQAVDGFLSSILGSAVALDIEAPEPLARAEAFAGLGESFVITGTPDGPNSGLGLLFVAVLEHAWLPRLSEGMLGLRLAELNEESEDLLREIAAQCHGALRNQFGAALPQALFSIYPTPERLPVSVLPATLLRVPFSVPVDGETLRGYLLVSAADAPEAPAPAAGFAPGAPAGGFKPGAARAARPPASEAPPVRVAQAAFPELGTETFGGDGAGGNLDLLADVELEITVEFGRRRMPLSDVLRLTNGSIIELEKLAGEPLQVFANGRMIAEGEAVVIDEQFGIRITRLATQRR